MEGASWLSQRCRRTISSAPRPRRRVPWTADTAQAGSTRATPHQPPRTVTPTKAPAMSLLLARRRFIGIAAAAGGLGLIPVRGSARAETHLVTWTGHVMGAVATMQIHHHDRDAA